MSADRRWRRSRWWNMARVQRHFGGRMRLVFRHFPLTEVHPHAESAEFAGAAGLLWEMHDALFCEPEQAEHTDDLPDRRRARASRNSNAGCLGDGAVPK